MNLRKIVVLFIAVVLLAGFIVASRQLSKSKTVPVKKAATNLIRNVTTLTVENKSQKTSVEIYGKLVAYEKVELYSEVTGLLINTPQAFKTGTYVKKGSPLLQIDKNEMSLNIQANRAKLLTAITAMMPNLKIDYSLSFPQWQRYLDNYDIEQNLRPLPKNISKKEKNYINTKNIINQYYNIKSQEARLDKYVVYAPISGILTQTMVTQGALVRTGQKVGSIMNTNSFELEARIPLKQLRFIHIGNSVELRSEGINKKWKGLVKRISKTIDPNTQSAIVYVSVKGKHLKENLYLKGNISTANLDNVAQIPRRLLINDSKVYIVQDSTLRQKHVEIIYSQEEYVLVKGLENGTTLLDNLFSGIYEGMKVNVSK